MDAHRGGTTVAFVNDNKEILYEHGALNGPLGMDQPRSSTRPGARECDVMAEGVRVALKAGNDNVGEFNF